MDYAVLVLWAVLGLPLSTVLVSRISLVFSLWFGLLLVNSVRVLVNKTTSDAVMSFMIWSVTRSLLSLMCSLSLLSSFFSLSTLSTYKRRNSISYLEAGSFRELRPKRPVLSEIYNTSKIKQQHGKHQRL